jgi:L-amino acid N-acyltransferase YncA
VATIRAARPADAQSVADIYNEGIATRLATFETEPRAADDIESWLAAGERLPVLVAEEDGRVLGWARILVYSERPSTRAWGRCRST